MDWIIPTLKQITTVKSTGKKQETLQILGSSSGRSANIESSLGTLHLSPKSKMKFIRKFQ